MGVFEAIRKARARTKAEIKAAEARARKMAKEQAKADQKTAKLLDKAEKRLIKEEKKGLKRKRKHEKQLAEAHPELVTAKMAKAVRPGKVFLDWSQNNAAKTTICPWSLRGRERPQVALPRDWADLEAAAAGEVELTQVTIDEV